MVKKKKVNQKESALRNFFLLKNPLANGVIIVGLLILIPLLSSWWTVYYEKAGESIFFFPPHYVLIPMVSLWILSKYIKAPASFLLSLGIVTVSGLITIVAMFTTSITSNDYDAVLIIGFIIGSLLPTILLKYSLKTSWQKSALIGVGTVIASALLLWLLSFFGI